ncbi:unnamed protein product [Closterium sp. NIES-64]|nr:unnamed protein product [Closterium sp. NIES-64]
MPVRSIPRTRSLECPPGFAPAKRVSRPGKRRTRLAAAAVVSRASKRTPKTFAELLEEANLETLPPGTPSYLTAAVGPPTAASVRRFCSAADLKQTSDDLSGSVKKAVGQAGRNVRNSIGSMVGVPAQQGHEEAPPPRREEKLGAAAGKKTGRRGGKKTGLAGARSAKSGAAAPKTSAAGVPKKQGAEVSSTPAQPPRSPLLAAAGATGAPKKQEAGAKDTSGAAPESPAAPAAANEPRALLEAADSDAVIDSVDSVDFDSVDLEDSRVLLSMGDAAADLKQNVGRPQRQREEKLSGRRGGTCATRSAPWSESRPTRARRSTTAAEGRKLGAAAGRKLAPRELVSATRAQQP